MRSVFLAVLISAICIYLAVPFFSVPFLLEPHKPREEAETNLVTYYSLLENYYPWLYRELVLGYLAVYCANDFERCYGIQAPSSFLTIENKASEPFAVAITSRGNVIWVSEVRPNETYGRSILVEDVSINVENLEKSYNVLEGENLDSTKSYELRISDSDVSWGEIKR